MRLEFVLLVSVMLLGLFFAYGCLGTASATNTETEKTSGQEQKIGGEANLLNDMERCKVMETGREQSNCYEAVALEYEAPSACSGIGLTESDYCYFQMAMKFNKASYCELIDLPTPQRECRNFFQNKIS